MSTGGPFKPDFGLSGLFQLTDKVFRRLPQGKVNDKKKQFHRSLFLRVLPRVPAGASFFNLI